MIKKIGFYICIGCILILCTYSIYLMYKTDANYKVLLDNDEIAYEKSDDEIYKVGLDNVSKTISVEGSVVPVYGEEQMQVLIEGNASNIVLYIKEGDVINKDFVYATYNGKEYKAESMLRCVDVNQDENGVAIEFIDYSKLYIELCIPEKYATDSMYNKKVELTNNEKSFMGEISYIDGYCNEGLVRLNIKYNNQKIMLRPGAKCNANIVISKKKNVKAVPLEFVMYSAFEDEYSAMLVDGDANMTSKVEVGIVGDSMVEILSGVGKDDIVMMPRDEMSLRYYLSNSQEVTK